MSETIQTKQCSKCKDFKQPSEFSKDRSRKDGLKIYCKSCQKIIQRNYQQTEKGKATCIKGVKKYQKTEKGKAVKFKVSIKYRNSTKGKATIKRYNQSDKGKTVSRKAASRYRKTEKGRVSRNRYHNHHPNHRKATNAVKDAIQFGKLPRLDSLQCHYCPAQAEQYHHHKGYARENWLKVVPVCVPCHRKKGHRVPSNSNSENNIPINSK